MTATLRFSRQARADLIGIWRGIARYNEMAANRTLDRIEDACRHLREFPHLGRLRLDLDPDGRVLVVDRWLVLYRSRASAVLAAPIHDEVWRSSVQDRGELHRSAVGFGSY